MIDLEEIEARLGPAARDFLHGALTGLFLVAVVAAGLHWSF